MKLLVLGGTRFLGRQIAALALERGHTVTLLHRGRSGGPALFSTAEHLIGDRDTELEALTGSRHWDAVIDTSAYFPHQVRAAAAALAGRIGHYQLVSTISVYASNPPGGNHEDSPRAVLDDPDTRVLDGQTYGGLKARCEDAAIEAFGAAATLIARPGLIVGPFDPTGRFSWWVQRLQRGGVVLAPGDPAAPVQFIDARDLAAWMLEQVDAGNTGSFNLTGPTAALTMGEFLDTARRSLQPGAQLKWIDEATLLAAGVAPWSDLPVWLSTADHGMHRTSIAKARATGLVTRPLDQTLRDTAAWLAEAPAVAPGRPAVGLDAAREAALLAAAAGRSSAEAR
jgi:2'-hydroxyisoflavone reductase